LWLQNAGYNTYYGGKLFNGHTTRNYNKPHMSGYTNSAFFLEPYTYQYFNVSYTRNGASPVNPVGKYTTDLLADLTQEFITDAVQSDKPFFITVAPIAPHGWLTQWPKGAKSGPPKPAKRHANLFKDYTIPRDDNFNPDEPSSVDWIAQLPKLNDTIIDFNDEYQRLRLRSLMSVDEMVGDIVRRLEHEDVADNTYIIYSTDNGFHISQHRLHPGKMCGLETDIKVPMIIRGPGIKPGSKMSSPSSHSDVAPTILQLAGLDVANKELDGAPMDLGFSEHETYSAPQRAEHIAVEFWGTGLGESFMATERGGNRRYTNNTYKGLRVEAEDYGFYYSVWCNNEKELYDMKVSTSPIISWTLNIANSSLRMTLDNFTTCCLPVTQTSTRNSHC
jgi:arylsulfatase A-like enzyme